MQRNTVCMAAAVIQLMATNAMAQQGDTCESVLRYAGRNLETSLTETEREAIEYFGQCNQDTSSANLNVVYEAIALGGGFSDAEASCTDEVSQQYQSALTNIVRNTAVIQAIDAWSECQRLNAAEFEPDVSAAGSTFTVGITNSNSAQPQTATLSFIPDDEFGPFSYECTVSVGGVPQEQQMPASVEVSPLVRAQMRCNISLHQYIDANGMSSTIRPGGVVTVDTVQESFALPIFSQDSSQAIMLQQMEERLTERVIQLISSSSISLHSCAIPNDGNWLNAYDYPVDFTCPANTVMVGELSQHQNGFEDRQFRFRCCSMAIVAPVQ